MRYTLILRGRKLVEPWSLPFASAAAVLDMIHADDRPFDEWTVVDDNGQRASTRARRISYGGGPTLSELKARDGSQARPPA